RQTTRSGLPFADDEPEERHPVSPRPEKGVLLSNERDLWCQLGGAILLATHVEEQDREEHRRDQVVERGRERERLAGEPLGVVEATGEQRAQRLNAAGQPPTIRQAPAPRTRDE